MMKAWMIVAAIVMGSTAFASSGAPEGVEAQIAWEEGPTSELSAAELEALSADSTGETSSTPIECYAEYMACLAPCPPHNPLGRHMGACRYSCYRAYQSCLNG